MKFCHSNIFFVRIRIGTQREFLAALMIVPKGVSTFIAITPGLAPVIFHQKSLAVIVFYFALPCRSPKSSTTTVKTNSRFNFGVESALFFDLKNI